MEENSFAQDTSVHLHIVSPVSKIQHKTVNTIPPLDVDPDRIIVRKMWQVQAKVELGGDCWFDIAEDREQQISRTIFRN